MNHFNSTNGSQFLEDWITPSALQDTGDDASSYWGSPYNALESDFESPVNEDTSYSPSYPPKMMPAMVEDVPTKRIGNGNKSTISVSPMFPPTLSGSDRPPADCILLSFDSIIFYVDEDTICKASNNGFNGILPLQAKESLQRLVYVPKLLSSELQIMLQVIYDIPFDRGSPGIVHNPTNQSHVQAVIYGISLLPHYGVLPKAAIQPHTNMFKYLLMCAPMYPLDIYALAAQCDIEELAVSVSSHLLSVNLNTISPAMAGRIGPVYLKKLFEMLESRKTQLKSLLSNEPSLHNPTPECGFPNQQRLKEAWNRAVSFLTWNLNAGIATGVVRQAILEATSEVTCPDCIKARDARLRTVCQEWSMAKRSI
ncbi:hypothetical protein VNI00_000020 [Paramarasmius palmivorus]|uniref:Uncharacterized protein n=1 Tax=Paramarasmius palmivorus TaxID=297713 RepID=A0AAW0EE87_9AGAR